jgi:hypothetical protein
MIDRIDIFYETVGDVDSVNFPEDIPVIKDF